MSGSATSLIGGARGVIIPHSFVRAINDVFLINGSALPSQDTESSMMEDVSEDIEQL